MNQLSNLEKTERASKLCPNQAENLPEPPLYNAVRDACHFFGADISDVNDHIVFEWLESFGYFGGAKYSGKRWVGSEDVVATCCGGSGGPYARYFGFFAGKKNRIAYWKQETSFEEYPARRLFAGHDPRCSPLW